MQCVTASLLINRRIQLQDIFDYKLLSFKKLLLIQIQDGRIETFLNPTIVV
jgi:hypothetical protein